jgi:general secretion pathway protein K
MRAVAPREPPRATEAGYALVAAVAAILVFAMLALGQVTGMRAAVISGEAEIEQARAAAAVDAGVALAIQHLLDPDDRRRWTMDGRVREARFDAARLLIRIDDERGKVPLNIIVEEQVTKMLELVGLSGEPLRVARDSYLDWLDDDDEPRLDGAESAWYARRGITVRNGPVSSIGELARIRGFTPRMVAQLQPFVTVHFAGGVFEIRYAQPQALAVMYAGGEGGPQAIARLRELAGQQTAIGFVDAAQFVGRPLGIHVIAQLPGGARAERTVIVELTGTEVRPYVIRAYD